MLALLGAFALGFLFRVEGFQEPGWAKLRGLKQRTVA